MDPLAAFKVLAVMCHPDDRARREAMLAAVQEETGEGTPRRRSISSERFLTEVNLTSARATVAGGLLLTRLQLFHNGYEPSLNRSIPLVSALLPEWVQEIGPFWHQGIHFGHSPTSRRKMLEAARKYRLVAHFWAALIHGVQDARDDIWPGSLSTIPIFLAYAESFLDLAGTLPYRRRDNGVVAMRREAWVFTVPANLSQKAEIGALPLNDEQIRILTSDGSSTI